MQHLIFLSRENDGGTISINEYDPSIVEYGHLQYVKKIVLRSFEFVFDLVIKKMIIFQDLQMMFGFFQLNLLLVLIHQAEKIIAKCLIY